MLSNIKEPGQIKNMSLVELTELAQEIRTELIKCISENGGHLASNLGIVELTLALHYVFNSPDDKLVFDVGHQSYVHKMLTGRYDLFKTIRKQNGLCGFPDPQESVHDCFAAGHASNALSAALGMIRGGEKNHVITIIGDGALTGGMCYEALNDAGQSKIPMIVILNDNEMSISRNVGAMSFYLDRLRRNAGYKRVKKGTKGVLERVPLIGSILYSLIEKLRNSVKALFIGGSFFEALGFHYIGPIDGHDISNLIRVLEHVKDTKEPLLLHVVTQKGKGYTPAENSPTEFHGVAPFYIDSGLLRKTSGGSSYGITAAEELSTLADSDTDIVVVSAAMVTGTGMEVFRRRHPDRFYDVGIAEEHAVTMAAGMAFEGKHPFVAIYSTFLQRCYDQIMVDVCRNSLPVTFLIDRAGFTGADGKTHQGLYDIGFLRTIPNLTILSARDKRALRKQVAFCNQLKAPSAIRYSRETLDLGDSFEGSEALQTGKWEMLIPGSDIMIIAEGACVNTALRASVQLSSKGYSCGVTDACFLKPIDEAFLREVSEQNILIVSMEENTTIGGLASAISDQLARCKHACEFMPVSVPDTFVDHATIKQQREQYGMDEIAIVNRIIEKKLSMN